jgi:hypothetical protein
MMWSMSAIHSLLALRVGVRYDTKTICASVFPDIERNLCDGKRRKRFRGLYLPLDNAPPHNAKRPRQEIARTKAKRATDPAHSPDGAPSDFFLFGNLKPEMTESTASSGEHILSKIRGIFETIPKEITTAVCNK